MRRNPLVAVLLCSALLYGCADVNSLRAPLIQGSTDYESAGDTTGVHAFVYGRRTVLAFDHRPLRLTVQDENGVEVPYEREGRYYRLARELDRFTVWANLSTLTFNRTTRSALANAIAAPSSATAKPTGKASEDAAHSTPIPLHAKPAPDKEDSLSQLFAAQQGEVRQMIAKHPHSASEAEALTARLKRVEAQCAKGISTVIRVQFESDASDVTFDKQGIHALIAAARRAKRINIEGHTDARIEGPDDLNIALRRARAARQFLVEQGIDGSKIRIAARPAGDFLASVESEQGRALNRRAEIELVHQHHGP